MTISRRNLLTQKRESFIFSHPLIELVVDELEPTLSIVRRKLRQSGEILMKSEYNKLTVDVIGSALWSAHLEQVCPIDTPFFVMDETARAAP